MATKYNLTDLQLRHLAIICDREQGKNIAGVKACASQMCNYFERHQKKKFKNIYECVFGSGWYTFYCFPDGVDGSCDAFGYISKNIPEKEETTMSIPDSACSFAENIAADQSHGYSQANRWGPDFDCSSLIIQAYITAGVPIDKTKVYYTGNMQGLKDYGFVEVTENVDLNTGAGMLRGDILYYHISGTNGHTAMFCGNGKIVHARGQSYGSSATGDQGSEIAVTSYTRSKWRHVLRYKGSVTEAVTVTHSVTSVEMPEIEEGSIGAAVSILQAMLDLMGYIGANYRPLDIDGEFGPNTAYALIQYQTAAGLTADGVCGTKTWTRLREGMKV